MGQPGYVGHPDNVPRSPYTRTLPQTPETRREAGLWSATASNEGPKLPNRKRGEAIPEIKFANAYVCPVAPEAKDAVDTLPTERCAELLMWSMWRTGLDHKVDAMSERERKCMLATALEACTRFLRDKDAQDLDQLRMHLSEEDLLRRLKMASAAARAAQTGMREQCGPKDEHYSKLAREYVGELARSGGIDVISDVVLLP